jgi:hypothetical protein
MKWVAAPSNEGRPPISLCRFHSFSSQIYTLVLTLALYELLIRRMNALRWLFGMKPRHCPLREQVKEAVA